MLQRTNPVPPGYYWVDVPDAKLSGWNDWLGANRDSVKVIETRELEGVTSYLFYVATSVRWEGPGYPTIASGSTQLDDTADRPEPQKELLETLTEGGSSVGHGLMWVGGGLLALALTLALKRR